MTPFDYAFLALLAVSTLVGIWRGFVSELFALLGWIVAIMAGWHFSGTLAPHLSSLGGAPWMRWVIAFFAIFLVVLLVMGLFRLLLRELLSFAGMSPVDRLLGALFGVLRAILCALLVVAAAGLTAIPKEPWWQESLFAPPLETAVLAARSWLPRELAGRIRYP